MLKTSKLPFTKEGNKVIINPRVPFELIKAAENNSDATNGTVTYPANLRTLDYTNYLGETVSISTPRGVGNAVREIRIGSGRKDAINLTPLFSATNALNSLVQINGKYYNIRDLIKFRIETINNDSDGSSSVFMIFRSY